MKFGPDWLALMRDAGGTLEDLEREVIIAAYEKAGGCHRAAKLLGITAKTVWNKLIKAHQQGHKVPPCFLSKSKVITALSTKPLPAPVVVKPGLSSLSIPVLRTLSTLDTASSASPLGHSNSPAPSPISAKPGTTVSAERISRSRR